VIQNGEIWISSNPERQCFGLECKDGDYSAVYLCRSKPSTSPQTTTGTPATTTSTKTTPLTTTTKQTKKSSKSTKGLTSKTTHINSLKTTKQSKTTHGVTTQTSSNSTTKKNVLVKKGLDSHEDGNVISYVTPYNAIP